MKQKDIAIIIVIAFVAVVASLVVSKLIFVKPANRQQAVEVVDPITTTFTQPNSAYFNSGSVDPAQTIQIGNTSNNAPFTGSGTSQ